MRKQLYNDLLAVYEKIARVNPTILKYSNYIETGIRHFADKIFDSNVTCIPYIADKNDFERVREYISLPSSCAKSNLYRKIVERLISRAQVFYFKKQAKDTGPIGLYMPIRVFFFTNRTYSGTIMSLVDEKPFEYLQLGDLVNFAYDPKYLKLNRIGPTIQNEVRELVNACGHAKTLEMKGMRA